MSQINEILTGYKYPLLIGLVGVMLLFSGSLGSFSLLPEQKLAEIPAESLTDVSQIMIKVDIAGAVVKPGVYELKKETRVEELVGEAGGFHRNANPEFVSKSLNLSQKLSDSQKIYIPFKGESSGINTSESTVLTPETKGKINVNTASQSVLEELPGVGPSTSSKIIAGRPYTSLNDLLSKKIVGKAVFEKIKDQIEL